MAAYKLKVYCVTLKRIVKVVYMDFTDTNRYTILICTDTELCGAKVIEYYQLRFQIEFLIRDAKQYTIKTENKNKTELYQQYTKFAFNNAAYKSKWRFKLLHITFFLNSFSNTTYQFSAERQSIINKFLLIAAISLLLINNTGKCIENTPLFYQQLQGQNAKLQLIDKKTLLFTSKLCCFSNTPLPGNNKLKLFTNKLPFATYTTCTYTPIWQLIADKLLLNDNKLLSFANKTLLFINKTLLFTNKTLLFTNKTQLPVLGSIYSSNCLSAAPGISPISARIRYLAGGGCSR